MTIQGTITQIVEDTIRRHANRWGEQITEIQSDQMLLEFVDSFGFFTLILEVERQLNLRVDLSEVDISKLAYVGGLVEFFIQQHSDRDQVLAASSQ